MAGENLGSVYYTVDAETGALIDAEKVVDKSTKNMSAAFKKAETAVNSYITQQKLLGRTVDANGLVYDKNNKLLSGASEKLQKLTAAAAAANTSVGKGGAAMAGLGRNAGMAGIQVQQFVGQIQGGQSAMLALSQQGADIGFVLGAPMVGAIVGIGASIAGMLLPNLISSTSALEKMEAAVERVKASITLSSSGIAEYSEEMKRLATISKDLLKAKLALVIADQNEAIKEGGKNLRETTSEATSFVNVFGSFDDVIKNITGKKLGSDGFNEAKSALMAFKEEVASFGLDSTTEGAEALAAATERLGEAGANSTKEGRELVSVALEQVQMFREGKLTIEELNAALKDNSTVTDTSKDAVKALVDAIELQAETIGMTEKQLAIYTATLKGATAEEIEAIAAAYNRINAYKQQIENAKTLAQKEAELAAQRKKAADEYNAQTLKELEAEERKRQSLEGQLGGIVGSDTSTDAYAKLKYDREQQLLLVQEYEALETANHQLAVDARAAIDNQYLEKVKAMNTEQSSSFLDSMEANGASLKSFQASAVGAFTSFAVGAQSGEEAIYSLAQSILTQMIGALVQMGIQALIGQATTAAGTAAAMGTIATAAAPAAAMVSLASYGANAAPAMAGITATTGLTQGLAIAGGRLYGGYTAPNSMYQVTENGRAEMFSDGKDSFLMTGSRGGSVTSNGDLGSSQPIINITTVNNAAGVDVQTSQSTSDGVTDVKLIISTIANDILSGGKTRKAITTATTAKTRVV